MGLIRSQLFVPANEEKKIRKSATLPCDSVIFDLEDSVPPEEKKSARVTLVELLHELEWKNAALGIRINKTGRKYSLADLDAFMREEKISFIVLPKCEGGLDSVRKTAGKQVMPLVETALGLLHIEELVRAEGIFAIGYGAADFANFVEGKTEAYLDNLYVKTKIVIAARAYGVPPVDNVFFDLADMEGFREQAMHSRGLGYEGKQVIHPSQVEIANSVFSPTAEEIEHAQNIVRAYEEGVKRKTGALRVDEKLVDAVHYRQAKALLRDTGDN